MFVSVCVHIIHVCVKEFSHLGKAIPCCYYVYCMWEGKDKENRKCSVFVAILQCHLTASWWIWESLVGVMHKHIRHNMPLTLKPKTLKRKKCYIPTPEIDKKWFPCYITYDCKGSVEDLQEKLQDLQENHCFAPTTFTLSPSFHLFFLKFRYKDQFQETTPNCFTRKKPKTLQFYQFILSSKMMNN